MNVRIGNSNHTTCVYPTSSALPLYYSPSLHCQLHRLFVWPWVVRISFFWSQNINIYRRQRVVRRIPGHANAVNTWSARRNRTVRLLKTHPLHVWADVCGQVAATGGVWQTSMAKQSIATRADQASQGMVKVARSSKFEISFPFAGVDDVWELP